MPQEEEDNTEMMETILRCAKEVGGPRQPNQHKKLSEEIRALLKKRRDIKTNNNIQIIEYTENFIKP